MSKREQARVLAVQSLYQWDLRGRDFAEQADDFLAESTKDPEVYFFARELTQGAWAFRKESDRWIKLAAAHWEMKRMAAVDRNILRLAIYEMLGRDDIPPRVAIDQAIELAKRFGTADSGGFVNGILDHVLREAQVAAAERAAEEAPAPAADDSAPDDGHPAGRRQVRTPAESGEPYPDIKDWDEE